MNVNNTPRQLIEILKSVISGTNLSISANDVDWRDMLELSVKHSVANIVAFVVPADAPQDVREKFAQHNSIAFARSTAYDYETDRIFDEFEKRKISYMPLKGYIMRNYYPSHEMRTMCDIDVLIKVEDEEQVGNIMCSLGYVRKYFERDDEITYSKPPFCSYEMHKALVHESHTILNDYYGSGWNFAKKVSDSVSMHKMTDEDYFIFLLAHFIKHYANGGIGVRAVVDIWIFRKKFKDELDWEYIDRELDKLKMKEFSYNLFDMIDMWFEEGAVSDKLIEMSNYILSNGVYGSLKQANAIATIRHNNPVWYFVKSNFKAVFLDFSSMAKLYPNINRMPPLILYYWIKRIFDKIKDGTVSGKLSEQQNLLSGEAERTKQHFKDIGMYHDL